MIPDGQPTTGIIVGVVADVFEKPYADILGKTRVAPIVRARHVAMYIAMDVFGLSSTHVGTSMGRDHTTVLHGRDSIRRAIAAEQGLGDLVASMAEQARRIAANRKAAEDAQSDVGVAL